MKRKNIKILLLAALAVLILSLVGCTAKQSSSDQPEVKTIKIGYLPLTHALPLFVEKELSDDLKTTKLELVKFGSWPELAEALNSGQIDGASVLIELALKAKEKGIDLKAVSLGHRDGNVVVAANNIASVNDLKGKTVAIPSKLSSHNILLYKMLQTNGLSYQDVKVVEMPPPEMPAALSEGRIASYIVAEPFGAVSVSRNIGKVLYESQDLWKDSLCCSLVLRNDFIKNNPAQAREFVTAYNKAGEKAEAKDTQIVKIAKKYMKVDDSVLGLSLKWISYANLGIKEAEYGELVKLLNEMKLVQNAPAYGDFIDNSLSEQK
ncbi:MAG TPA: ABC transporter substrate-binding protein [Bacillota bacterium]|nr:ABC transporter substrate-binding protein [Bacillota bacterium]